MFIPIFDTRTVRQVICSDTCCVIHYDKQKPKSKKLAREVAKMIGKRSMGEVRFTAAHIEGAKLKADYEPDTFDYHVDKICSYTPDFKIKTKTNRVYYIEYKGVLDLNTRNKMKLVKAQHPKLDIRFVFQKASNKIRKGSKTSYGMWADQHGFRWADNCIPKGWLK
jgi:hypothetical protein